MGNITLDDIKRNHGKEFTGTVNGEVVSGIIDVTSKGTVYFYFNSKNGAGWSTTKEPGYTRGWNIGNGDIPPDLAIKDYIGVSTPTPSPALSTANNLPEYFTIKGSKNNTHPLWKKYIDWLNKKRNSSVQGSGPEYYGLHKNLQIYNWEMEMQGELEITLEFWDRVVNSGSTDIESPDESDDVGIPEYFYIKKDSGNPLWGDYIRWLNATYNPIWGGTLFKYFGYDGNAIYRGTNAYNDPTNFINGAKEITLEFWNIHMNSSKLPMYATEDMGSATDIVTESRPETPGQLNSYAIQDAMDKLRNADPYDVLSQSHVAHNTLTNDYIDSAIYRTASLADMGIRVNAGVPAPKYVVEDEAMSGPYVQPEVPVKKSRYSSMLDLI